MRFCPQKRLLAFLSWVKFTGPIIVAGAPTGPERSVNAPPEALMIAIDLPSGESCEERTLSAITVEVVAPAATTFRVAVPESESTFELKEMAWVLASIDGSGVRVTLVPSVAGAPPTGKAMKL